MRVLQLIDSLEPGGAERMAVSLANELAICVDKSFLCATREEGLLKQTIYPEVGYFFLEKKGKVDVRALSRLKKFIQKNSIQVVHAHSSSVYYATAIKKRMPSLILIWHDHYGNSEMLAQRPKKILNYCSKYFDGAIAVNATLKKWSESNLKTTPVLFIKNFVSALSVSNETKTLEGVKGKRIVCVANVRVQKNHALLIKAFKIVQAKIPEASLHLIGAIYEDEPGIKLKEVIQKEQVNNIHILGKQLEVSSFLKEADVAVLSSISEGLPVSLLEYGMSGLPVVCTNVGDCKLVLQGRGRLVPSEDSAQLAEALLFYLNNLPAAQKDAQALKQHVINDYSFKSIATQLLSLYNQKQT